MSAFTKPTSDDLIERARSLRQRFSLQLEESQKAGDGARQGLAQLDDVQRRMTRDRLHAVK